MNEITDSLVSHAKSNLNRSNIFSHHYLLTSNKDDRKETKIDSSEISKKIDKFHLHDNHFFKTDDIDEYRKSIFKDDDDNKYVMKKYERDKSDELDKSDKLDKLDKSDKLDEKDRMVNDKSLLSVDNGDEEIILNDNLSDLLSKSGNVDQSSLLDDISIEMDNTNQYFRDNKSVVLKWVDDQSVSHCHSCRKEFSIMLRKHHCRHCGRVFCSNCADKKIKLPVTIFYNLPEPPSNTFIRDDVNSKLRVCKRCYVYVKKIYRIRKIIKIFELSRLNLRDLYLIGKIKPEWYEGSKYCIDKLRHIQDKLCIEKLKSNEKRMIWLNKNYLKKSPKWLTLLIRSVDLNSKEQVDELERIIHSNKIHSSDDNLCRSFSQNYMGMNDILNLVRINKNVPIISNLITKCFERIELEEIIMYMPFLIVNQKNNIYLYDILVNKCKDDFNRMVRLYLNIKVFCDDVDLRKKLLMKLFKESIDDNFKADLLNLMKHNTMDETKFKDTNIIIPLYPNIKFDRIDFPSIKIMDSFSRPMVIPFIKDNERKEIMFKNDDIRKDYLILIIIDIIHQILREEEGLDIKTVRYRVQPTSSNTGYIEFITNACTIFEIIHTEKITIQNYILNHNHHVTVKEFRERFMQSTALYCMISYLLGFGDRHLDNIMISEDGLLFHIDFGFILGQDPKYSNNKSIRITSEIIEVIGGERSDDYQKFKSYCARIYNRLRLHVNLFANLLSILPSIDSTITMDVIKREIIERFEVGEYNIDAMEHMSNKVEKSNDIGYATIDGLYKMKKTPLVKTLKKGFTHASNFLSNFL